MPVKLRLQRHGRKKRPFYHIVVADARAPRDGKFIEKLGTYDPTTQPANIDLNTDKALDWLQKGAQPTNTVRAILSYTGVMYRKHLQRGVKKGAFSQDEADSKFASWIREQSERIMDKKKKLKEKKVSEGAARDAQEKAKRLSQLPVEEAPETVEESPVEEVAAEAASAEEVKTENASEEQAAVEEVAAEETTTEEATAETATEEPAAETEETETPAESTEAEAPAEEEKAE